MPPHVSKPADLNKDSAEEAKLLHQLHEARTELCRNVWLGHPLVVHSIRQIVEVPQQDERRLVVVYRTQHAHEIRGFGI